jgi:putative ABC transport system permease protein
VLHRLRSALDALLRRQRFENAMADELEFHIDACTQDLIRSGVPREEAARRARAAFGGRERVREECRQARGLRLVDELHQDFRYAARMLRRNPIFTLTAALSLAIGIGANTTIFSIANRLLLRDSTGVSDPDRLVDIGPTREDGRFASPMVPYPFYGLVRERVTMLSDVYGYQLEPRAMSLTTEGSVGVPDRVFGTLATPNYFTVLGVRPAIGRLFDESDEEAGSLAVAVLSERFWSQRFNADPTVVGRTVRINGQPTDVIGVAAAGFQGTIITVPDLWLPISAGTGSRAGSIVLGGRLADGVSTEQAAAEIAAIGRSIADAWPLPDRTRGLGLARTSALPPVVRRPIAAFLTLLTGIVSIVLAIACSNVAGVLLARAVARRREMAVRLTLGAGRARLVRQLLTETALLFSLGSLAGLLIARAMAALILTVLPAATVPLDTSLPLDWRVLLFTVGLSLAASVLSGLVPSLQASRAEVIGSLKADAQGPSDRLRLRSAFVIAQVAFSVLLIIGAGLFVRALHRVASVDLGFDPDGVETASLDLSLGGYTNVTGPVFARELIERVRRLPGVQAATLSVGVPGNHTVEIRGGPPRPGPQRPSTGPVFSGMWRVVDVGYFDTLRIPLVAGRDFTEGDTQHSMPVAIISESAARELWPGQNPLGRYFQLQGFDLIPAPPPTRLLVVGVVRDLKSLSPRGPSRGLVYRALQQDYTPRVTILARTTAGQRIAAELRTLVASMDPYLPIVTSRALADEASPMLTQLRISAAVSGTIGLVGVLLAAMGIYGVTAYTVTRRTREIGVRIALGAQRADVIRMILRHGMSLVGIGSVVGLLLAAAASRLLVSLLFGVPPLDPLIFGGAVILFASVGLTACYVPVRRATRIDAMEALRYE